MAFKMKGNPFPKKGGAFKQDTQLEYKAESQRIGDEYTQHMDSLGVILNDLKQDLNNKENLYKKGDITYKEYSKAFNLHDDFIKKYNIESEEKFSAGESHMKEFGDSLDLAVKGDLDAFNVIQQQYMNDDISKNDYLSALEAIKKKRPNIQWSTEE